MDLDSSRMRVEKLKNLKKSKPDEFELWKYYEDRADKLGDLLWTYGVWFMAIIFGALSIPFSANFIDVGESLLSIKIERPFPVLLISLFGLIFCLYSYNLLQDVKEHVESNWRKSGYVLNGVWESNWGGRKGHGWKFIVVVGAMAFLSFLAMFLASLFLSLTTGTPQC